MHNNRPKRPPVVDRYFSFMERRGLSDKVFLYTVLLTVLGSLLWLALSINNHFVTIVPTSGGSLVEGIVGTPRFVNPVLAITRADHDMVALIYSGLIKLNNDGTLTPDVAESINISEDGRTYHIKLRENVTFHDGSPLTVKDVAYTIALIQNPELKSPLQGNWDGVLVEELGDYEMNIILEEAYTPFIENLRVGILPRELWDELPTEQMPFSQNNTEPVGSGPYKIVDVLRNKSGLINGYRLEAFSGYGENPNITSLVFNFYQNETDLATALKNGTIAGAAVVSDMQLDGKDYKNYKIIEQALPRTFAVYFNQNKSSVLREAPVREALNVAIDREALISEVLNGFGVATYTPVPPGFAELGTSTEKLQLNSDVDKITKAKGILTDAGWSQNDAGIWVKNAGEDTEITLKVNLATANTPLFDNTANYIAKVWQELGVEVAVSQYEQADLVQAIIRPRNFEALLFGADIGRGVDLFPFWHSSQKDDPGLNIAQYTNIDSDALLEDIRVATNETERDALIAQTIAVIAKDNPAIFLFSPTFRYLFDPDVQVTAFTRTSSQSDRFANISSWHMKSDKVWPIFQNN